MKRNKTSTFEFLSCLFKLLERDNADVKPLTSKCNYICLCQAMASAVTLATAALVEHSLTECFMVKSISWA